MEAGQEFDLINVGAGSAECVRQEGVGPLQLTVTGAADRQRRWLI